jgi:hypothetical protein
MIDLASPLWTPPAIIRPADHHLHRAMLPGMIMLGFAQAETATKPPVTPNFGELFAAPTGYTEFGSDKAQKSDGTDRETAATFGKGSQVAICSDSSLASRVRASHKSHRKRNTSGQRRNASRARIISDRARSRAVVFIWDPSDQESLDLGGRLPISRDAALRGDLGCAAPRPA